MKKKTYKNEILFVVVSTFIIIVLLVVSNVYNKSVTSTLNATLKYQTQPITPTFDMNVVTQLRQRRRIEPLYTPLEGKASDSAALDVTPTPEPDVPIATEEAALIP